MLAGTYYMEQDFPAAAKYFRQALEAVLASRGFASDEARVASEELTDLEPDLPPEDSRLAAAVLQRYADAATRFGLSVKPRPADVGAAAVPAGQARASGQVAVMLQSA